MTESNDFDQRRKHPRHDIEGPIQVVDRLSGDMLGIVANMSLDGVMLVGKKLDVDRLYQLAMNLPARVDGVESVDIVVDCLWSSASDQKSDLFFSGCHIIDCTDNDVKLLEGIINAQAVG